MGIAALGRVERAKGLRDIGGEGVDADLELDEIGGRPGIRGGGAGAMAQRLNGGANAAGVGGGEREFFAVDFDGFTVDVSGDLPEGAGGNARDFREPEVGVAELGVLTDETIGMRPADAGILFTEFLPRQAEVIEHLGITNLLETLGAGGGAIAGEDGEGLLEADPGAEIDVFFCVSMELFEPYVSEIRVLSVRRKDVSEKFTICTKRTGAVLMELVLPGAGCLGSQGASHILIVSLGRPGNGCGRGWDRG